MKRILITGATGFIGKNLLKILSKKNYEIKIISRKKVENDEKNISIINNDLSNINNFIQEIINFNPEIIIHLAWEDIPDFSFEKSYLNLNNSIRFLSMIRKFCNIKKIIISGSCFELGSSPEGSYSEKDLGESHDFFTWAKQSLKNWLEIDSKKYNYDFLWMRIFYVYGPGQRKESLIPYILTSLNNNLIPNIKALNNKLDFIYIEDVVSAFVNSIERNCKSGIYNIGTGKSNSVLKVFKEIENIMSVNISKSNNIFNLNKEYNSIHFWCNNELTKKELNWKPKHTIQDGLKLTIEHYLKY